MAGISAAVTTFIAKAAPYIRLASGIYKAVQLVKGGRQQASVRYEDARAHEEHAARQAELGALRAERKEEEGERAAATLRSLRGGTGGSALLLQKDIASRTKYEELLGTAESESNVRAAQRQSDIKQKEAAVVLSSTRTRAGTALLKTGLDFFT